MWPFIDTTDPPVRNVFVPVLVNESGTKHNTYTFAGNFAYGMTDEHFLDTV